jgi:hypothetical protein
MRIPTGLGRLAYLAILQQQLLEDHEELFGDWHCCSLQQKHDWLYRLLVSASQSGTLPDEWLAASTYADLVPRSAQEGDRNTYRGDIEAILDMLKDERSAFCGEEKEEKGESPAQQLGALSNFSPCVSK